MKIEKTLATRVMKSMLESAHLFRSPYEINGLYDHLFGGLFLIWGFPIALQLLVFLGLFCGIAATQKFAYS